MAEAKNQKEVGRIPVTDYQTLVISLVNNSKLDIRIWIKGSVYEGPTKRGIRFNLYDENWDRFKEIMAKVDGLIE